MKKRKLAALLTLACGLGACDERTPTSVSEGLLPVAPVTVEVLLPWSAFASRLDVFGGFGSASDRGTGLLANAFGGLLDARSLVRLEFLGLDELVVDTTGTLVHDTIMTPRNGRLVVFFDTLASRPTTPVTVSAHRTLTAWDPRTASWTHAVDSAGDRQPWPEPGAGPAERVASGVWDRAAGDSVVLNVDPAGLRAWTDSLAVNRGLRLDVETPGSRIEVRTLELRYELVPSVRPDTALARTARPTDFTFIYTPQPGPPAQGLRVGGIPGWRSVIHMDVPDVLTGPPALCAALGCPFELTPERVNHASLVLQTRPTDPAAFQPTDTVRVDVRPVLAPERGPRSPLGGPVAGPRGRALAPAAFTSSIPVAIPVTALVRAQLEDEPEDGLPAPRALALLSFLEPASIAFANFAGPGEPGEPTLRLILTAAPLVELP